MYWRLNERPGTYLLGCRSALVYYRMQYKWNCKKISGAFQITKHLRQADKRTDIRDKQTDKETNGQRSENWGILDVYVGGCLTFSFF